MSTKRRSHEKDDKTKKKKSISDLVKEVENRITTVYWAGDPNDNLPYLGSDSSEDESENDFLSNASFASEEEVVEKNIKYYKSNNVTVIILKKNTSIYLTGACRIQILHGGVNAFGYEFCPGNTVYDLFSLRGWSQIYLCYGFRTVENCRLTEILKNYNFERDVIKEIYSDINLNTAVICCFPLDKMFLKYVEKCVSAVILPPIIDKFQIHFDEYPTEQVLKITDDWYKLIAYTEKELKVILCGGKGVGKSTLLRFMINRLLMFHERIYIIDLDPGQSEFTMPGCISIVVVDKPIFGPNFTHQQNVVRSILQNVDVSYTPLNYLGAVQELYKSYAALDTMPTLINTMGFTKGLGLDIISGIIAVVDPKVVIEIKSYKPQRDFPKPLTKDTIYQYCSTFISEQNVVLNYNLISLNASFEEDTSGFKPVSYLCRDISTISYFGNILDRTLSLRSASIPMYKINLDNITVLDSDFNVVKSENKAAVINANVVALSSVSEKTDVYNCYGYGIVRNVIDKELYLITPVKDSLDKVTHLVVGIVQIPASMLDDGAPLGQAVPYFARGCSDFSHVPRRSYLPRR